MSKTTMPKLAVLVVSALALSIGTAHAVNATKLDTSMLQADVEAAQAAWGEALVRISQDFAEGGIEAARATAEAILDTAYGFDLGPVLFKPTLTTAPRTFRTTRDGALAYFVGHDENFPEDSGFALKGWQSVEIDNAAIFISGDMATTMGNVHLTDGDGNVTTVDKTWGFVRDETGDLRIVLHHSSLPFRG
ncbi:MAG: phosphoribosyl-AMP cyclohydrolase [Geminicoccaceae bacterium]|nr:MAG: phosphoribosyl-AMP cyclohydrolase [Geminicoccaceae bacterium]